MRMLVFTVISSVICLPLIARTPSRPLRPVSNGNHKFIYPNCRSQSPPIKNFIGMIGMNITSRFNENEASFNRKFRKIFGS